ncbi:MAG: hypothetical protein K0M45_00710 [Candidatus Paracaedibacteraceae bacterium]|nr:hypothetical protein [Candidatus Paracaedibacteraceae bacterium]
MKTKPNGSSSIVQNKFHLKNEIKNAQPSINKYVNHVELTKLESLRLSVKPISASRYGLEAICGASCAIGSM